MMTQTASPPRCSANATGRVAGDWGMESLPCRTSVGLRSFFDRERVRRFYCPAPEHRANVERRYGTSVGCHYCHRPLIGDDWRTFDDRGALFMVCGPCESKGDEG